MKTTSEILRDKKVLIITNTPYQLLVSCSIALEAGGSAQKIDLAVDPSFEGAKQLAGRIRDAGYFNTVSCEKRYPRNCKRTTLAVIKGAPNNNRLACQRFHEAFPQIKDDYDILMTSFPTLQVFDGKKTVGKNAVTWFIDDGSGSRNGNVFTPFACMEDVFGNSTAPMSAVKRMKCACKDLLRIPLSRLFNLSIQGIALFSPTQKEVDLYGNIITASIKLPDQIEQLQKVFAPNLKLELYEKKQVYFLTLPSCVNDNLLDEEAKLARKLHEFLGDSLAVRPHPRRDPHDKRFDGLPLTSPEDSWEIMILSGLINESSTIVAYASTAQMTPKVIMNAEPTVIYLFDMLPSIGETSKAMESQYLRIRDDYDHTEKVYLPKNTEDLVQILMRTSSENC